MLQLKAITSALDLISVIKNPKEMEKLLLELKQQTEIYNKAVSDTLGVQDVQTYVSDIKKTHETISTMLSKAREEAKTIILEATKIMNEATAMNTSASAGKREFLKEVKQKEQELKVREQALNEREQGIVSKEQALNKQATTLSEQAEFVEKQKARLAAVLRD